jgi:hypothetical protein
VVPPDTAGRAGAAAGSAREPGYPRVQRLAVALVVLLSLLLVVDRVAGAVATGAVATQVQRSLRTSDDPIVDLGGFPFLTQVLAGRYDRVEVRAGQAAVSDVALVRLHATLTGVRVPLRQAVRGSATRVQVEQLRVHGVVSYAELVRLATARLDLVPDGGRLSLTPVGDRVQVSGTLQALGRTVEVTALSRVEIVRGDLSVMAESYTVEGATVEPRLSRALDKRLDLRLPVEGLPAGLHVAEVQVQPDGLAVLATAADVVLSPEEGGAPTAPRSG